jgi:hypothetical protein
MIGYAVKKLAKFSLPCLLQLMLIGVLSTHSVAQEQSKSEKSTSPKETVSSKDDKEGWRFKVNIYSWLPKAPANIKVDGHSVLRAPESLDNILDSLEMMAMFELELHKGPLGIFASPIYYRGKYTEHFNGALGERRKFTLKERLWLIKYGVSYDFEPLQILKNCRFPSVVFQPYVGGLYFHDKIQEKISPGVLDIGLDFKTTIEFNAPIVGMNTLWDLTRRFSLRIGANFGGWSVDRLKSTHEFIGDVSYNFKMFDVSSKLFAGYRYLHLDYKKSEIELHIDVKGPFFGIGWEF